MRAVAVLVLAGAALALPPAVSSAPTRCGGATTTALVRSFVANRNAGRSAASVRAWASEPAFQWYSTGSPGERLGPRAYDRATLRAYFDERALAHERLVVQAFGAGYDPKRDIVNFAGMLVRTADDRAGTPAPQSFKGAATCRTGVPKLIVWSM
jgi:hypothetical protein